MNAVAQETAISMPPHRRVHLRAQAAIGFPVNLIY
jgi:hypothetical protein